MAELNTSSAHGRDRGFARSKKLSTRVDLTPMVDLGFLLITFFVFTTTATEPTVMKINTPADSNEPTEFSDSKTLTVIPVDNNKIVYYHGELSTAQQYDFYGVTNFSVKDGIGEVIRQMQRALESRGIKKTELALIIRPSPKASYKNAVDILDEVTINDVKIYSLTDLTEDEKKFLLSKGF